MISFAISFYLLGAVLPLSQIGGNGGPVFQPKQNAVLDTSGNGGRFYFSKVLITEGITVRVVGFYPAIIHCSGDVQIQGTLTASAVGQLGGPGGGKGGNMAGSQKATAGTGPGGGQPGTACSKSVASDFGGGGGHATEGYNGDSSLGWAKGGAGGKTYGFIDPMDLTAGSGGGGGCGVGASPGGGGGGFLAILADGQITLTTGSVSANGGGGSGGGSGGKILLRSIHSVVIGDKAKLEALGGAGVGTAPNAGKGGNGYIRIDALLTNPDVQGTVDPKPLIGRMLDLQSPASVKIGTKIRVKITGVPGGTASIFLLAPKDASISTPLGILKLDPTSMIVFNSIYLSLFTLDAHWGFPIPIPNDSNFSGLDLHQQVLLVSPRWKARLSMAVRTRLRQRPKVGRN